MNTIGLVAILVSTCVVNGAGAATRDAHAKAPAGPPRTMSIDQKWIDVNAIAMAVTNTGSVAYDGSTGSAGFEFPRGSGKTAIYAAGLWLGANVGGGRRVTVSEYSDEYGPGAIVNLGGGPTPDVPTRLEYKVYKLKRNYGDASERDSALADYDAGAVPHGAPPVLLQPDGSLGIRGDQMLWAVYNDLDPSRHTNRAGHTSPLGVEVQQTTYAYDRPGALGSAIFIEYRIINKGPNFLGDMYVSQWADPDLGGFTDDLVGCDVSRRLGFVYNATNNDAVFGVGPPCVGIDFLRGPVVGGNPLGLASFDKYINGTDPTSAQQTYNYMQGYDRDGNPVIDPTTGLPTTYSVSGDPVAGTGWIDSNPADRRMLLSSGPFQMASGDTQRVVVAIVVGKGSDRLSSITAMKFFDDAVQAASEIPVAVAPSPGEALANAILEVSPNPSHGPMTIGYSLPRPSRVRLSVADVQGRELAVLADGAFPAGRHSATWNGRAARGEVPAGVYFIRFRSEAGTNLTRRVVVAR